MGRQGFSTDSFIRIDWDSRLNHCLTFSPSASVHLCSACMRSVQVDVRSRPARGPSCPVGDGSCLRLTTSELATQTAVRFIVDVVSIQATDNFGWRQTGGECSVDPRAARNNDLVVSLDRCTCAEGRIRGQGVLLIPFPFGRAGTLRLRSGARPGSATPCLVSEGIHRRRRTPEQVFQELLDSFLARFVSLCRRFGETLA